MIGKPKIDLKRAIKYSWIATNISLFQLGVGSYVLYPDYFVPNDYAVLYLMFLSFPSSIPVTLVTASVIDLDPSSDYLVICFVAFSSGYLQWFWCIPRFLQQPDIISLHLTDPDGPTHPNRAATESIRRRKSDRSRVPRGPFDRTGHSPLERAIGIKRG